MIHTPHESYLEKHEIKKIHEYIKKHELPSSNVFYASCCLNAEDLYQQFCDENNLTPAFRNIYSSTFLKFSCDEAIRTINNGKIIAYVSNIKKKDFLIFNRRWHWHRIMFLYNIFKNNINELFYISFSKTHLDTKLSFTSVIENFFKNKNDEILDYDIVNTIENSLPLILDTQKFNEKSLMYEKFDNTKDFYLNSMIHIISESKFESEVIHCTEKTFKPIIHKQPFIVLGPRGMLKKIKELGFKSFDNVWDESYDDIVDHEERLLKIVTLCKTISEWSPEKKIKAMQDCANNVNYNFYKLLQFKTKHDSALKAVNLLNSV